MVIHVVLVKPKESASLEEIQSVLDQAKALKEIIPGIVEVEAGKNVAKHQGGFEYGLVMRFDTMEHLQAYLPHPAHLAVVKEIVRLCDTLVEFDLPA